MRLESWEEDDGLVRLPIRSGRWGGSILHVHNGSKGAWWNVGGNATMLIIIRIAAWENRDETGLEVCGGARI